MATTVSVPFSRRVISGALVGLFALAVQSVIPGYNPDPIVLGLVTQAATAAGAWAVTEQRKYLTLALSKLDQLGK